MPNEPMSSWNFNLIELIQTQLIHCHSQIPDSETISEWHTFSCHAELVSASRLMHLY